MRCAVTAVYRRVGFVFEEVKRRLRLIQRLARPDPDALAEVVAAASGDWEGFVRLTWDTLNLWHVTTEVDVYVYRGLWLDSPMIEWYEDQKGR